MRVNKRIVFDIGSGKILERDSFNYARRRGVALAMPQVAPDVPGPRPPALNNPLAQHAYQFYHRRTYTDNTTTQLTFFDATGAITTTNIESANRLPGFFELHHIGVYLDIPPSAVAIAATIVAGAAISDTHNLLDAVLSFSVGQKLVWQSFLWNLPPGGGVHGGMAVTGTYTATDGDQATWAANGMPDLRNRSQFWGGPIPADTGIKCVVDWPAAVDTVGGNYDVIVYIEGYLNRAGR